MLAPEIVRDLEVSDRSWRTAKEKVEDVFSFPGQVTAFCRSGWRGQLSQRDFLSLLSLFISDKTYLLRAAGVEVAADADAAEAVERAVATLGVRMSTLVFAICTANRILVRRQAGANWNGILSKMITAIEIGHVFGDRSSELSCEEGALMGFARWLGHAVLFSEDPERYRAAEAEAVALEETQPFLDSFGCHPYQVAVMGLQRFGFGYELAVGAALAAGQLSHQALEIPPTTLRWKAAYEWVEALGAGRNFPASVESRSFFRELGQQPGAEKNIKLEVLHAAVAKARTRGSTWTWHRPVQQIPAA